MHLEILTPEKKIFEGDVTIATFPGEDGSFQVMDNHAPLIGLLKEGVVEYKFGKGSATHASTTEEGIEFSKTREVDTKIFITGGVVEVLKNKVILLADGVK